MAHLAAVAHYTEMARQAAAMQSAQIAYDNRAEPEQDDDAPTEDQAREAAAADVLATPATIANWLACECAANEAPADVRNVTAYKLLDADVPTLLAVLFAGDDKHAMRALGRLRELAAEGNEEQTAERAAELLAGGL